MTPRERVMTALQWGKVDAVPFTMYETMIPQCTAEREVRNDGLCIVKRDIPVFDVVQPNVKTVRESYVDNGQSYTRTQYETPVGTVDTLASHAGFTKWYHETMFKSPEDYATIRFILKDEQYVPQYDRFRKAADAFGPDAVFRASFGREPLQTILSAPYMDTQQFCIEWMDNRDEILAIYEILVEKRRNLYRIVAESPAQFANYGGNVVAEIVGLDTFQQYYAPHYNEAAEIMHRNGKMVGCHFDGNCRLMAESIAGTDLDYIEAFTPAPDTDMTLTEARAAWPEKVLWLNFPSSLHLSDDETVENTTVSLLDELDSTHGLIMGITEDIPADRWQDSCRAIMRGLKQHAAEYPSRCAPGTDRNTPRLA